MKKTMIVLTTVKGRTLFVSTNYIDMVWPTQEGCGIQTSCGTNYGLKNNVNFVVSNVAEEIIRPSETSEFDKVKNLKPSEPIE